MTTTITTVWADHIPRGGKPHEIRHTRQIDSHVTLCGLGTNLTRNYSKHPSIDHRCQHCADVLGWINVARAWDAAQDAWQWPDQHAQFVQAQRAEFDIDERRIDSANFPSTVEGM